MLVTHLNGAADILILGHEGAFEAREHWQEGGLLCAEGRWRLTRGEQAHYVGGGLYKWPLQHVREIRQPEAMP